MGRPPLCLTLLLLLAACAVAAGCEGQGTTAGPGDSTRIAPTRTPTSTPAPAPTTVPTQQPSATPGDDALPVEGEARLGACRFALEVADTSEEQARGLMERTHLPDDRAMLFLYPSERVLQFWMYNTLIPLDIVFVDGALRVVDVQTMVPEPDTPPERLTVYASAAPAQYAIEMGAGRAESCGIGPGGAMTLALSGADTQGD